MSTVENESARWQNAYDRYRQYPGIIGAGISRYGDYNDLRSLHETIHELCKEGGPLIGQMNEFVLGPAYDIRHTYQGDREMNETSCCGSSSCCSSEYYTIMAEDYSKLPGYVADGVVSNCVMNLVPNRQKAFSISI